MFSLLNKGIFKVMDKCYFCENLIPKFAITPLIELIDGMHETCEKCVDIHFPGWEDEDEELTE